MHQHHPIMAMDLSPSGSTIVTGGASNQICGRKINMSLITQLPGQLFSFANKAGWLSDYDFRRWQ
jgi:hypothetical protein